ncbi:MAG: glycosyltransferase family 39 protein [Deltaproteobacteria bacterium]|nr:glycosyltransferase family 39 protein [Deltaproteobacteria bacterium]
MIFNKRYFFLILSIMTIFRIWYIWHGPFNLSPDEAHYWDWSRRLDLSYYSKGPMVAYVIAFFTKIGGNNEVSVRIGAVIIAAIVSLTLYTVTRDIFNSERAGFFAGLLPSITPLYAAGSVLMTTDAPFIMFWGLAIYFCRKALVTEKGGYWHLTGIAVGLGLLSKYTMALIFPCLLLYLLFYREDRFHLKKKEPYIAFIISLVIFSPVIIWNIQHDFVTLRHTMGQAHVERGPILSIASAVEFLGSQIGVLTPFVFLAVMYGTLKTGIAGFRQRQRDYLLLFFTSMPVFLFFLAKSLQADVEANWAAPAYFTAFACVGIYDGIYERFRGNLKKWAGLGLAVMLFTGLLATTITYFPGLLKLAGLKDIEAKAPINRVIAWKELGLKVGDIYNGMAKNSETFILSDTYQMTSELAFYIPDNPVAYNVNLGNRRMNQYDIWGGLNLLEGKNAVYVKGGDAELDSAVEDAFENCDREPLFEAYRNDLIVRRATIYRCYNFKGVKEKEIHTY